MIYRISRSEGYPVQKSRAREHQNSWLNSWTAAWTTTRRPIECVAHVLWVSFADVWDINTQLSHRWFRSPRYCKDSHDTKPSRLITTRRKKLNVLFSFPTFEKTRETYTLSMKWLLCAAVVEQASVSVRLARQDLPSKDAPTLPLCLPSLFVLKKLERLVVRILTTFFTLLHR